MTRTYSGRHRRGVIAIMAIFLVAVLAVFAVSIATVSTANVAIGSTQNNVTLAMTNAESGMRWMSWRLASVQMPTTVTGTIDNTTAANLWPTVMTAIQTDVQKMTNPAVTCTISGTTITIGPVSLPGDNVKFSVVAKPSPESKYSGKAQVIQVKSTGTYGSTSQAIAMNFLMQKSMRYAVLSRVQVQLGCNTILEGDLYQGQALSGTMAPFQSVNDFRYTTGTTTDNLTKKVQTLQEYFKATYAGYDNRVPATSANLAAMQAYNGSNGKMLADLEDANNDGYLDSYDVFLKYYGSYTNNKWQVTSSASFSSDPNLFKVLDGLSSPVPGAPSGTPDAATRAGYNNGVINADDPYFKVKGTVKYWDTEAGLKSRLASGTAGLNTIQDTLQGTIISRDGSNPVQFGCSDTTSPSVAAMEPDNYNTKDFLAVCGSGGGTAITPSGTVNPDAAGEYANTTIDSTKYNGTIITQDSKGNPTTTSLVGKMLTAAASGGGGDTSPVYATKTINGTSVKYLTQITETIPYGSVGASQTVTRKVFSNMNFRNCIINRGTNAVFINCTFDGVTFVDASRSLSSSTDFANGNALRFDSCTFTGPIVQGEKTAGTNQGKAPATPTLSSNKWEFTGDTTIDFSHPSMDGTADSATLTGLKQQATIVAPQTSMEFGAFGDPSRTSCNMQGIVVAENIDIRSNCTIDGTLIATNHRSTGDNCTLGYFGSSDGSSNVGQPSAGMQFGRIYIRYNPFRTLPNGINLAVSVFPDLTSWTLVSP